MRRALIVVTTLTLSHVAAAQVAAPASAAPPAPASAAPAAPADPLAEPRDIVEVQANTKDNLKKAIGLYEAALKDAGIAAKTRANGYADESRAWLRLGDLETAHDAKIDAYTKGREAAKKGLALDGNNVEALFWDNANQAVIGRTNGVMNSLFMVPDLKKGLNHVIELSPHHSYAKNTLAQIDHKVPGLFGGSDDRAEATWLQILKEDPGFTPAMHQIAEFYKDKGNKDEAKKWATTCISVAKSSVPNDYKKFDKHDCQQVLKDLAE